MNLSNITGKIAIVLHKRGNRWLDLKRGDFVQYRYHNPLFGTVVTEPDTNGMIWVDFEPTNECPNKKFKRVFWFSVEIVIEGGKFKMSLIKEVEKDLIEERKFSAWFMCNIKEVSEVWVSMGCPLSVRQYAKTLYAIKDEPVIEGKFVYTDTSASSYIKPGLPYKINRTFLNGRVFEITNDAGCKFLCTIKRCFHINGDWKLI